MFLLTSEGAAQSEHGISISRTGKSIVEFLAGTSGLVIGFVFLKSTIMRDPLPESWEGEEGFPCAVAVTSVSALGSSGGVYFAGESLKDEGSLRGAFLGALVPPLFLMLGKAGSCPLCGAVVGSLASSLGATIGYGLSRRVQPSPMGALFHIENGALSLGVPSFSLKTVLPLKGEVTRESRIILISARF